MVNPLYWNDRYRKGRFEWGDKQTLVAELALDIMERRRFTRILDVGCGYGRDCIYLARSGFDVIGIDISAEALKLARDWAKGDGLKIDFMHMDITDNSFEDSRFDTVIMFNTFHFMREKVRERTVSELYRILRDGGVLVQAMFSRMEKGFGQGPEVEANTFESKPGRPVHFFSEEEIRDAFARFAIDRLEEVDVHEVHQDGNEHFHREWLMVGEKR